MYHVMVLNPDGSVIDPSVPLQVRFRIISWIWFQQHKKCPFRFRDPVTGYVTACTRSYRHPGNCGTKEFDLTIFPIHPDARELHS